jgi:hypothetical protein
VNAEISPTPSDDEAVAIAAATEALWPKAVVVVDDTPDESNRWRFSGRWWIRPLPMRRDRPYV